MKKLLLLCTLALPLSSPALTINFTDTTPANGYPNFDPNGALLADIVAACKTVWQDIIEDSGTVNITYRYAAINAFANEIGRAHV